jgi:hypothetical protein
LNQRCAPLLKFHISDCSTSLVMCTVSSIALVCTVFPIFAWCYCQIWTIWSCCLYVFYEYYYHNIF